MTQQPTAKLTPLRSALQSWLLDCEAENLSEKTLFYYETSAKQFLDWCEAANIKHLEEIDPNVIRHYSVDLRTRKISSHYHHNLVRVLRTWFNFCVKDGLMVSTPFERVKVPKPYGQVKNALSADQIKLILGSCKNTRDRCMVYVLLDSGVRISELCALNVGDVDMKTGEVHVQKGKGGKGRYTHVSARTRKEMLTYLRTRSDTGTDEPLFVSESSGNRLTKDGATLAIRRLRLDSGVKDCAAHSFRRTCAITMMRQGVNIYVIARMLGHATIEVLKKYLPIANQDVAAAHKRASPVDILL